jgi:hypothetical protein
MTAGGLLSWTPSKCRFENLTTKTLGDGVPSAGVTTTASSVSVCSTWSV